jgi:hypothetical protein
MPITSSEAVDGFRFAQLILRLTSSSEFAEASLHPNLLPQGRGEGAHESCGDTGAPILS